MSQNDKSRITLIGADTIGLSSVAYILRFKNAMFPRRSDTRPCHTQVQEQRVVRILPAYIDLEFATKSSMAGGYDVFLEDNDDGLESMD